MKDFVNVGLLGAGTVGGGVLKVLEKNAEKIAKEVGKPVRITKVLDRHVDSLKQEYGDKYVFTDNADEVLRFTPSIMRSLSSRASRSTVRCFHTAIRLI